MIPRSAATLLIACALFLPHLAAAQVCTPACAKGTVCAYTDTAKKTTGCLVDPYANAQTVTAHGAGERSFRDLVNGVIVPFVNNAVLPLLYAIAFLAFLIGLVRYFFVGGEEEREKGKQFIVWGLLGLTVLFSVWGIVKLLLATLNLA